ncbi:MAG: hypothetical protein LIO90_02450 [Bacteroidales bacterium]|nr:hypothetical protein [Bacteroidales bacterium]
MKYEILPISKEMLQLIERQAGDRQLQPLTREILLLELKLASTTYSEAMAGWVEEMIPGTELTLVRTPSGDDLCISVLYHDQRIGIIPMEQNVVIARLMDAGKMLTCRVNRATIEHDFMSGRPWVRILVKIYLID